jgi:hypothetical protein
MFLKALKVLAFLLVALTLYIYLQFFSGYVFPWDKQEAIQTTTEWGGLAPLPAEMEEIDIEKEGSLFTRQFIIEFTASQEQIQNWIKNSKRLKNNSPEEKALKKIYNIHPGEVESFGGNVEIEGNNVKINMSWS